MENTEVMLTPSGHCDYLIPESELYEISELVGLVERRSLEERWQYEQTVGNAFERLTRELTATAMESTTDQLHQLSMQLMAALNEFKREACELLGEMLIEELGKERAGSTNLLLAKIRSTVEQLAWPDMINLFVNPDQLPAIEKNLRDPSRFNIVNDPSLAPGNFRLELGRTSMTYDLGKDLRAIAAEFREKLSRDAIY